MSSVIQLSSRTHRMVISKVAHNSSWVLYAHGTRHRVIDLLPQRHIQQSRVSKGKKGELDPRAEKAPLWRSTLINWVKHLTEGLLYAQCATECHIIPPEAQ